MVLMTLTSPYIINSLETALYIEKSGFRGVYINFLIFRNINCS